MEVSESYEIIEAMEVEKENQGDPSNITCIGDGLSDKFSNISSISKLEEKEYEALSMWLLQSDSLKQSKKRRSKEDIEFTRRRGEKFLNSLLKSEFESDILQGSVPSGYSQQVIEIKNDPNIVLKGSKNNKNKLGDIEVNYEQTQQKGGSKSLSFDSSEFKQSIVSFTIELPSDDSSCVTVHKKDNKSSSSNNEKNHTKQSEESKQYFINNDQNQSSSEESRIQFIIEKVQSNSISEETAKQMLGIAQIQNNGDQEINQNHQKSVNQQQPTSVIGSEKKQNENKNELQYIQSQESKLHSSQFVASDIDTEEKKQSHEEYKNLPQQQENNIEGNDDEEKWITNEKKGEKSAQVIRLDVVDEMIHTLYHQSINNIQNIERGQLIEEFKKRDLQGQMEALQLVQDQDDQGSKYKTILLQEMQMIINRRFSKICDEDKFLQDNSSIISHLKQSLRNTQKQNIPLIVKEIYQRNYKIKSYLTSGGQADILVGEYEDFKNQTFEECIIRIVNTDKDTYDDIKEEYELVKTLIHTKNMIRYFDSIYIQDIQTGVFIVEKCEGSLTEVIRKKRSSHTYFTEFELCKIIFDLIHGLIEMRSSNILHQDIKPDNILINKKGQYVLSDFGCSSKFLKGKAENKGFTMRYCAPEQLIEDYFEDYSADVFQVGRTLQQILDINSRLGAPQTIFIQKINEIILTKMIQESINDRADCTSILRQLCDLIMDTNQKQFIEEFYLNFISILVDLNYTHEAKDTLFTVQSVVLFHLIFLQMQLYQEGFQINVLQREDYFLTELFQKLNIILQPLKSTDILQEQRTLIEEKISRFSKIIIHLSFLYEQQEDIFNYRFIESELLQIYHQLQNKQFKQQILVGFDYLKIEELTKDYQEIQTDDLTDLQLYELYSNLTLKSYDDCEYARQINYSMRNFILMSKYLEKISCNPSHFPNAEKYEIVLLFFRSLGELGTAICSIGFKDYGRTLQERAYQANQNNRKITYNKIIEDINISEHYYSKKQYRKASDILQAALDLHNKIVGEKKQKSPIYILILFKMASIELKHGDQEVSFNNFQDLLQIIEESDHLRADRKVIKMETQVLEALAYITSQLHKNFKKGIEYNEKIIQHLKTNYQKDDLNNMMPILCETNWKLGLSQCQPEVMDEMKSIKHFLFFLENVQRKEKISPDEQRGITIALNCLGSCYGQLKLYTESKNFYLRLISALIDENDYHNPLLKTAVESIQQVNEYIFEKGEDDHLVEFVRLIFEQVVKKDISDENQKEKINQDLTIAYQNIEQLEPDKYFDTQFILFSELVNIMEIFQLIESQEYVMALQNMTVYCQTKGDNKKAAECIEKQLPISQKIYIYPSEFLGYSQKNLASLYSDLGDKVNTSKYYLDSLNTFFDLDYQSDEDKFQILKECIEPLLESIKYQDSELAIQFFEKWKDIVVFLYEKEDQYLDLFNSQYLHYKKLLHK